MTIIRTDMKKTLITKTDILPNILKQQTRLTMNQAKEKNRKFPNSMTSAKRKKRKLPDSIIQPNIGLFSDIWTRIPPRSDSRSGLPQSDWNSWTPYYYASNFNKAFILITTNKNTKDDPMYIGCRKGLWNISSKNCYFGSYISRSLTLSLSGSNPNQVYWGGGVQIYPPFLWVIRLPNLVKSSQNFQHMLILISQVDYYYLLAWMCTHACTSY